MPLAHWSLQEASWVLSRKGRFLHSCPVLSSSFWRPWSLNRSMPSLLAGVTFGGLAAFGAYDVREGYFDVSLNTSIFWANTVRLFVGFRKSRHSLCRSCSCWASWYCNGGKVWIENNFSFTNARKFHSGLWSQNHLCLLGLSLSYRLLCWLNTGKRTCKWCWKNVRAILYTNMYTVYNMNTKFNDIFESKPPASQSTKERWVKRKSELSSTGL